MLLQEYLEMITEVDSGAAHPSQYNAPQGSKRDKQLDQTKADFAKAKKLRLVVVKEGTGWMLQAENKLPESLSEGSIHFIPRNTYHRIIKGSTSLVIEIEEKPIREYIRRSLLADINKHILEENVFNKAMGWIKEKGAKGAEAAKDFLVKFKQELSETKEGIDLLKKIVNAEELTAEEQSFLKQQAKDIAGGTFLLGLFMLPGGAIATTAILKLSKKYNIELVPTAYR